MKHIRIHTRHTRILDWRPRTCSKSSMTGLYVNDRGLAELIPVERITERSADHHHSHGDCVGLGSAGQCLRRVPSANMWAVFAQHRPTGRPRLADQSVGRYRPTLTDVGQCWPMGRPIAAEALPGPQLASVGPASGTFLLVWLSALAKVLSIQLRAGSANALRQSDSPGLFECTIIREHQCTGPQQIALPDDPALCTMGLEP